MPLAGSPIAIVLAAGRSSRLGRNKLLEPLGGVPMIERTVRIFLESKKVHDVVVVVPKGEREPYEWLRSVRVHLVETADPDGAMIASIRAGLKSAWSQEKDFLIHPGDVPFAPPTIVDRLVTEFPARSCRILLPAYKGLGGHPGLYAASLREEFFLHGDLNGARDVLLRHRSSTVRLNLPDPDVCFDVDTPEDVSIAMDPGARWARVERQVEERRVGRVR
jgi:molybdenum cofactor cytidylyltransferase